MECFLYEFHNQSHVQLALQTCIQQKKHRLFLLFQPRDQRVILKSAQRTNRRAGEIMSELMDGSVVVPMATCWSYHQLPSSRILVLLSLFENRAISTHPL